uniref:FAD synthase n=1 Tax=Ditylenchus dipsaci TaxID=166011 RepID=A0A915E8F8_9BILA
MSHIHFESDGGLENALSYPNLSCSLEASTKDVHSGKRHEWILHKNYTLLSPPTNFSTSMSCFKPDCSMQSDSSTNSYIDNKIDKTIQTITTILSDFGPNNVAISFNGGKDCTVLLHLYRRCLDRYYNGNLNLRSIQKRRLNIFYSQTHDDFPQMIQFIKTAAKRYQADVICIQGAVNLKDSLTKLKNKRPEIEAILFGTRSTDPLGPSLNPAGQWSLDDWPRYYLLYDQGYTSIGGRSNTVPNPSLLVEENGENRFLPAYCLDDEKLERCSRVRKNYTKK